MTEKQRWISKNYIFYKFVSNLWFISAVWLLFYRFFITDRQVGILDGMAFAIGLLAEVPSGALADKFGRDTLVRLGYILVGVGYAIQAMGHEFIVFFLGQAVLMMGFSFISGADEALYFEELHFKPESVAWRKLVAKGSQAALIATLIATIVGGWLHPLYPRLPWFLVSAMFFLSLIIIWPIKDTRKKVSAQKFSVEIKDYITNITKGFSQLFSSKLMAYVPLIVTVQGLFYTSGWGLLRLVLLDRFHFDAFSGSVVVAISSLVTVGLLAFTNRHTEKISEKSILLAVSLSATISLLFSIPNIGSWGSLVILALYAGEHIFYPFMSEILNKHAHRDQRATVLSVASFLRILPYVILAPIIGYLNTVGRLEYFLVGWTMLIFLAIAYYLSRQKQDSKITVSAK